MMRSLESMRQASRHAPRRRPFRRHAAAAAAVLWLSGCGPLLVAGAAVGGYVWSQGALSRTYRASVPAVHAATEAALRSLGITILNSEHDSLGGKIDAKRAGGEDVDIRIHRRDRVTEVKVRVGIVGDRAKAQEIHEAIARHL